MKILSKFLILAVGIAVFYLLLLQVNWKSMLQIEHNQDRLEKKLGKLVLNQLMGMYKVVDGEEFNVTLDSIFLPLLTRNHLSTNNYELFLVKSEEINAFALPDDKIVVTTGLINFLDSSNYLSAILAHEIAHCEKNHVMRALITNFGLDLLLSGSGTGEITNFITGQAYSRRLENEADELAIDYLESAQINPKSLAQVMELFEVFVSPDMDVNWISSHPAAADRKAYLMEKIKQVKIFSTSYKKPISIMTWIEFKEKVFNWDAQEDYNGAKEIKIETE